MADLYQYCVLLVVVFISTYGSANGKTKPTLPPLHKTTEGFHPIDANASYIPALEKWLYNGPDGDAGNYRYDRSLRPKMFSPLHIEVYYYLMAVDSVDEKEGVIGTTGTLSTHWHDERLVWDPEDFGGITYLMMQQYKIWRPMFLHSGGSYAYGATPELFVMHNGLVTASVILNLKTPCKFDMTDFPKDTQICKVHLFQVDHMIKLEPRGVDFDIDFDPLFKEISEATQHRAWETKNVTLDTGYEDEGYGIDVITIGVTIKRHGSFFLRTYVGPVCFLLLLIPNIFLLPPDSPEKLTYGAILLFCMVYLAQSIDGVYPPYTTKMPYLMKLTTASGTLLFLCILLTSLMTSAERIGRKRAMPAWIKRYIIGKVGKFMLVREDGDTQTGSVHIRSGETENDKSYIVQHEQAVDFSGANGGAVEDEQQTPTSKALMSLVSELKQNRRQVKAFDDWTNLFTIINRFLFLVTFVIAIVIMLCFI